MKLTKFNTKYQISRIDYKGDLSKKWFIEIIVKHDDIQHKFQKRGDINKLNTITERKSEMDKLVFEWETKLQNGWIPTDNKQNLKFIEAIDFCLAKKIEKGLEPNSINSYKYAANQVKLGIKQLNLNIGIQLIKRSHIMDILDHWKTDKTNSGYNSLLSLLSGLFSELKSRQIIELNPVDGIPRLQLREVERFAKPKSADNYQEIISHLEQVHPRLAIFAKVLTKTLARPKDLIGAKVGHYKNDTLTIYNGKTKVIRVITIPKELDQYFKNLENYNPNWYIFGQGLNISQFKITRQSITKLWAKYVLPKFKVNLYGLKYYGIDQYILNDIDFDTIRHQAGHSKKQMTERYASQLKQVYHNKLR